MRRLPALTLALAVVLATATACGSDSDTSSTAAPSSSAASTVTVTAPPSTVVEPTVEETTAAPAPEAGVDAEAADTDAAGGDVCATATEESLLAALKSDPDLFGRVANPTGFRRIQCSAPFVLGSTSGTVQSSGVLFRREGARWTAIDVGSAIQCAQYGVTAANALEGCVV